MEHETEKLKREITSWVKDAVELGITASKVVDSNFWGELEKWKLKKDERDEKMHDSILRMDLTLVNIEKQLREYKEAKIQQNGRISKLEEAKNFSLGGIKIIMFLVPIIISSSALLLNIFMK